jgi:ADP-ribose pyrophosphatase
MTSAEAASADAVTPVLEGRITNATTVAALLALQALRSGGAGTPPLRPADAPFMERPGRD